MQNPTKLIIPLGLHKNDADAILWGSRMAKHTHAKDVLFFYASDKDALPAALQEKLPSDEELLKEMSTLVEEYACEGVDTGSFRFQLDHKHPPTSAILKAIQQQDSDCVIIGKNSFYDAMPIKLARKAPCSIMSVPENSPARLHKLMLAHDLSKYAQDALANALAIAKRRNLPSIESVHVYSLGPQHHKITIPENEQIAIAKEFAEQRHKELVSQIDPQGVQINLHNYFSSSTCATLLEAANDLHADLLVVSCRGKDALTAWLLGSTAETLLTETHIPVLASKIKGTGQNFLNVLLGE